MQSMAAIIRAMGVLKIEFGDKNLVVSNYHQIYYFWRKRTDL